MTAGLVLATLLLATVCTATTAGAQAAGTVVDQQGRPIAETSYWSSTSAAPKPNGKRFRFVGVPFETFDYDDATPRAGSVLRPHARRDVLSRTRSGTVGAAAAEEALACWLVRQTLRLRRPACLDVLIQTLLVFEDRHRLLVDGEPPPDCGGIGRVLGPASAALHSVQHSDRDGGSMSGSSIASRRASFSRSMSPASGSTKISRSSVDRARKSIGVAH
jgi:hypothetical protein